MINFVLTIFKFICHFNKEVAYSNISRLSQQVIFTDLSGAETNYQISNKSILSLTATVRDHHSPASILRHFAPGMISNKLNKEQQNNAKKGLTLTRNRSQCTYAWIDSVTEPIWLTLRRRALAAFKSIPFCTLLGLVTKRSSL